MSYNNINKVEEMVNTFQKQVEVDSHHGIDDSIKRDDDFYWTLENLCESTNGDLVGPLSDLASVRFNSISTDTRTLQPGALYIAIKGENFDGHSFIDKAVQQGAVAVLVSEELDTIVPGVLVNDTRIALGRFASWHRLQMPVKTLVAITGSNGKTTVKTLLAEMFSLVGHTLATEGNLNNDLGVPRTLLNLRPKHEFAIIEMGANHLKEISYLTDLAKPDIALVNNASGAHLEGFGSLQGVIDTKGEIYQGLNQREGAKPGVAVINTDSLGYDDWLQRLQALEIDKVVKFGTQAQADIKVTDFNTHKKTTSGITFTLCFSGAEYQVNMPILGSHNALNAAACVGIAQAAGLTWQQFSPALMNFSGVPGRLQKTEIKNGWLIDDSYNANPESVKAGITALVSLPGQAILCLGAMAEIGESSVEAHQDVASFARQSGVSQLFVFGVETQCMLEVFGEQAHYYESQEQLANDVIKHLKFCEAQGQKTPVLVKGSRSAKMEQVSQKILAECHL